MYLSRSTRPSFKGKWKLSLSNSHCMDISLVNLKSQMVIERELFKVTCMYVCVYVCVCIV